MDAGQLYIGIGRQGMTVLGVGELCLSVYLVVVEYGCIMYNMNGYITAMDYTIEVSIHHVVLY